MEEKARVNKIAITALIILIVTAGLWLFCYSNNVVFKFSSDKNTYTSADEIITEYEYNDAVQIQVDDYCYIINHGKRYDTEELLWEKAPNEYIIFNEWRELRIDSFDNFELPYFHEFLCFVHIVVHDDKYIILINHFRDKPNARVYDRYGDWEYVPLNGEYYYLNVLNSDKVNATYIIYVEVDGEVIELIDKDGLLGKDD